MSIEATWIYSDTLYDHIQANITGRIAITCPEAELLAQYASNAELYVEIGCLWGGTAILAALVGAGKIITIDFMRGGFWDTGDPACNHLVPSAAIVLDNLVRFGVAHRISVYKGESDPWPLPEYLRPDVLLIDGDHSYEGCFRDWENAKSLRPRYVLIHDNDDDHSGVKRAIDEIVAYDADYLPVKLAGSLIVLERATDASD